MLFDIEEYYSDFLKLIVCIGFNNAHDGKELNEENIDKFIIDQSKERSITLYNLNKQINWSQTCMHLTSVRFIINMSDGIKFHMAICINKLYYNVTILFDNLDNLKDFMDNFLKTKKNKICVIALTIDAKYDLRDYNWNHLYVCLIGNLDNYNKEFVEDYKKELLNGVNCLYAIDKFDYNLFKNSQLIALSTTVKNVNKLDDVIVSCKSLTRLNIIDLNNFNEEFIKKMCLESSVTQFSYQFLNYNYVCTDDKKFFKHLDEIYKFMHLDEIIKNGFINGNLKCLRLFHYCSIHCVFDDKLINLIKTIRNIKFKSNIEFYVSYDNLERLCNIVNENNIKFKIEIHGSSYKNGLKWKSDKMYELYHTYKYEYNSFILLKYFAKHVSDKENKKVPIDDILNIKRMHQQKRLTLAKLLKN